MSREWNPGDVAMIGSSIALRTDREWRYKDGSSHSVEVADHFDYTRPLVVIDPEDIPGAGGVFAPVWLRSLARDLRDDDRSESSSLENVLTFLAEAIDATNQPPRPEEPQGLGAVVEDAEGCRWVRAYLLHGTGWVSRDETYGHGYWPDMSVVRVLSEGVPWGAAS